MVGEMQAMEGAAGPSTTFPTRRGSSPWTWRASLGRVRHVEIYIRLLEHLGGYIGEYPETTILWRCACAEDAAARVAGVNRASKAGLRRLQPARLHRRKMGDPILERAVDFVLADEITHVRSGSKWLTRLTEGDPERAARRSSSRRPSTSASTWRRPALGDHEVVPISIATEARKLAASPMRRSSVSSSRRSAPRSTDRHCTYPWGR